MCAVQSSKPEGYFNTALERLAREELSFWVVHDSGCYLGHVRLLWYPDYPGFNDAQIPEISDLNVAMAYRRRGIGTKLIQQCEAVTPTDRIGIGVGLYPGYNNAQRLYTKLGFVLDGRGVHYKCKPVLYGERPPFDDDLVIYFTKNLSSR